MTTANRPKRRFPHFGVMLFATVLLLVGVGALTVWLPYHREQLAIAEIEKVGGQVATRFDAPGWLQWFNDDDMKLFNRVDLVSLTDAEVDDGFLIHLAELRSAQSVWLNSKQATDAGLAHVVGLTDLRELGISPARNSGITVDSTIAWRYQHTPRLTNTGLTDDGLEHLAGLSSLTALWLPPTQISDAGLSHLSGLPNLRKLHVDSMQITDAGLEHLAGLTNLEWLSLNDTRVTKTGVAKLQTKLPRCKIQVTPNLR